MKKNLSKYKKINIFVSIVCAIFTLSLTVGYAILSQDLSIKGNATIRALKDIRITGIGNFSSTNNGYDLYNPNYTENSISSKVDLVNLLSTVTYTVTIVNNGTLSMKVDNIIDDSFTNSNMEYVLDGIKKDDVIEAQKTVTFTITYKYKDTTTTLPSDTTLGSKISFNFIEYVDTIDYITDNMLLDLRGTDPLTNNTWYDRVNNKEIALTNVSYNSNNKSYDFDGNSFGTLGGPIIPQTGDFTLEIRATYPTNIKTVTDQAMVSQLSDTSNDAGRFKIGAYYKDTVTQLRTFINDTNSTNPNIVFKTTPTAGKVYLAQLVRSGGKFKLYLDGDLVTTYNLAASNKVSQGPFKIGKWNNNSTQYYTGKINAIRLYNRALTDSEILNNKNVDIKNYVPESYRTLKGYAVNTQIVTSGSGLYANSIGGYSYRGSSPDNYLKFRGNDEVYRIVSYNEDGSMKVLSDSTKINIPFDESGNRDLTSTYCDSSETVADTDTKQLYRGCNAWQKTVNKLTYTNKIVEGTVLKDATVNTYLNTTYYDTISESVKSKILTHDFNIGLVTAGLNADELLAMSKTDIWNGNIGLLTTAEVLDADLTRSTLGESTTSIKNYINVKQGLNDIGWTMTAASENTYDVYAYATASNLGRRRASRYYQNTGTKTYTMYANPTFYVNSDIENYSGSGSITEPFIIK